MAATIALGDLTEAEAIFRLVARKSLPLDGLHEHWPTTSIEFQPACPSSAAVMRKVLRGA